MGHVGDLLPERLLLPAVGRPLLLAQLQQVVEADQQLLRPGAGAWQGQTGRGLVGHLLPHPAGGLAQAPLQGMSADRLDSDHQQQGNDNGSFHGVLPFVK